MAKINAKWIKFDTDNLENSSGNLALKFSDSEAADTNKVWSSSKVKDYADTVAQGLDPKASCRAATTAALPSCTYNNGTSGVGATLTGDANGAITSQDGITLIADNRVLVKNQTTAAHNGIYVVTSVGDASNPFVLTRSVDFDDSPDGEVSGGAFTFIEEGTTQADSGWVVSTNGDINIGTTAIDWAQFSGAGQVTAGTGLTKDGNTVHVGDGSTGDKNGISRTADDIGVATGTGLEVSSDAVRIASSAAGDGLTGGGGSALSVQSSDLAGSGLEEDGGNNLRIAAAAAGDGLQGGAGSALAVDVSDFAGSGLEDDGSENLRIATDAAGNGLTGGGGSPLAVSPDATGGANLSQAVNVSTNGVAVKIDDTTVGENASHQLVVKSGGIGVDQINSAIAGDGLQGGSGSALAVDVSDFAGDGLEDDGSENLRIASSAAGNGLTGGSGSALAVSPDTTGGSNLAKVVNVVSNGVSVKIDDSTIGENGSNQLEVKSSGITETHLNASVAGDGLSGGGGTALSVNADDLLTGGSAEIDGDKIDIDWDPSNYTPATTPSEVDSVDNLTAHLYGIDQAIAGISTENTKQEMHKVTSAEVTAGYFTLSESPSNAQSVRVTIVEGPMQVSKQSVGSTGVTPDFDKFLSPHTEMYVE
jgi:hypothetical protein